MTHALSQTSFQRLQTCHPDLQLIITEAIKYSPVDFGVSYGHRTPEEQNELYQKGRTTKGDIVTFMDGYDRKSKHNESPSHAVDIYCWPMEVMYDEWHLMCVVGVVLSTAARLYEEGKIKTRIRSGVDWNKNGIFVNKDRNEKFTDMPHFEII
jgi:peptidoglycan L-alanyl-D-glutamate endopeptidase CwlK